MKIKLSTSFLALVLLSQAAYSQDICGDIDKLWEQAKTEYSDVRGSLVEIEPSMPPPAPPNPRGEKYRCKEMLPGAIDCEIWLSRMDREFNEYPKDTVESVSYYSYWNDDGNFDPLVQQIRDCGYQLRKFNSQLKDKEAWNWDTGDGALPKLPAKSLMIKKYKGKITLRLIYRVTDFYSAIIPSAIPTPAVGLNPQVLPLWVNRMDRVPKVRLNRIA